MFRYPVIKNCIRHYKYKILNEDLLVIEALNRNDARGLLHSYLVNKEPSLMGLDIKTIMLKLGISESLSLPITGETKKNVDGVELVWVGNGWKPFWEYKIQNGIIEED